MANEMPSVAEGLKSAQAWLAQLAHAVQSGETSSASALFLEGGYWRDILALSWDLRTFSGRKKIQEGLDTILCRRAPNNFTLEPATIQVFKRKAFGPTIEAYFTFETDIAKCRGHLRLLLEPGTDQVWKGWTLLSSMEDIKGHEERVGERRPIALDGHHGTTEHECSAQEHARRYETTDPDTVIIGGAQAGLTLAARLGQMGVPTLVVERDARIGDVWRKRYASLVLHNQIWANHFPYLPFPSSWPAYVGKNKLADWLESYATILAIAVWTSTELVSSHYDEKAARWTVTLRRGDGSTRVLHPRHVVLATGVFGAARRIEMPGAEKFAGRILNAAEYRGEEKAHNMRVLVIGTGSSAHDVAQDLHSKGAKVTMLQRSSTCVVSVEPGATKAYSIYSEHGAPVEDCDMISNSFPFPLLAELHKEMTRHIAQLDAELLEGLRNAGFALNFGDDGSGFLMSFFRHGGGYYINVGASQLIIKGEIKIKQGTEVQDLHEKTVRFSDGTTQDFDMIVVAIGYQNMQESIRTIFGDEVANRVGPVWGFDEEGELRAMWKRTGQRGFWIAGGSLQQCRPFSKYLALQIKGDQIGLLPSHDVSPQSKNNAFEPARV
jgi:cation diffusion facilitator CzcD-associated flavoprotein CzcO